MVPIGYLGSGYIPGQLQENATQGKIAPYCTIENVISDLPQTHASMHVSVVKDFFS